MIVPISSGGGESVYGNVPSQTDQLMAVAQLHNTGQLQPESAEPAPESHKSIKDQLKGKVA